jgi:ABC-type transporter MlaC component
MNKILSLLAIGLALSFGAAHAADDAKNPQQNKMAACNADNKAKTLKGDERKAFMKECLSAKAEPAKPANRMAACNADNKAKTLKGDERKAFMKECLSNK